MARSETPAHWIDVVYNGAAYGYAQPLDDSEDQDGADDDWDRRLCLSSTESLQKQILANLASLNARVCSDAEWAIFGAHTRAVTRKWPGNVLQFVDAGDGSRSRVGLNDDVLAGLPALTLKRAYALADVALRNGDPSLPDLELAELAESA